MSLEHCEEKTGTIHYVIVHILLVPMELGVDSSLLNIVSPRPKNKLPPGAPT